MPYQHRAELLRFVACGNNTDKRGICNSGSYTLLMKSLADSLRRAILESGMTPTELARRASVPQPCVSVFVRKKRDLTLATAGKICRVLGLELKKADHQGGR